MMKPQIHTILQYTNVADAIFHDAFAGGIYQRNHIHLDDVLVARRQFVENDFAKRKRQLLNIGVVTLQQVEEIFRRIIHDAEKYNGEDQSWRSATMGSTRKARRAGTILARSATAATKTDSPSTAKGS